jgi:hypothetical protein
MTRARGRWRTQFVETAAGNHAFPNLRIERLQEMHAACGPVRGAVPATGRHSAPVRLAAEADLVVDVDAELLGSDRSLPEGATGSGL